MPADGINNFSGKFTYDGLRNALKQRGIQDSKLMSALSQIADKNDIDNIRDLDGEQNINVDSSIFNNFAPLNVNSQQDKDANLLRSYDAVFANIQDDNVDKLPPVFNADDYDVVDYDDYYAFANPAQNMPPNPPMPNPAMQNMTNPIDSQNNVQGMPNPMMGMQNPPMQDMTNSSNMQNMQGMPNPMMGMQNQQMPNMMNSANMQNMQGMPNPTDMQNMQNPMMGMLNPAQSSSDTNSNSNNQNDNSNQNNQNNNSKMDFETFKKEFKEPPGSNQNISNDENKLQQLFNRFDTNSDSYLDKSEQDAARMAFQGPKQEPMGTNSFSMEGDDLLGAGMQMQMDMSGDSFNPQ